MRYNAQDQLRSVTQDGRAVKFIYDGDGRRIAMRVGSSTVYYLLTDHLGSTAITANSSGGRVAELRYKAWGETRYTYGTTPTAYKFTGQRLDESTGLYYYGARYYDPVLGRFLQPDTIVPDPGAPQDLNRFSYVRNNPLRYIDPSGRCLQESEGSGQCTLLFEWIEIMLHTEQPGYPNQNVFNRQIWIAAKEAGISPTLVKAVVAAESGFDPNASSGAAVGLMQLTEGTARGEGLKVNDEVDERYDSLKNLEAGAGYLRRQYDAFKDATGEDRWKLAATAYTAGSGTVQAAQGYIQDATSGSPWYGRDPNTFDGLSQADAAGGGRSPLSKAAYEKLRSDLGFHQEEDAIPYANAVMRYIGTIAAWLEWMRR